MSNFQILDVMKILGVEPTGKAPSGNEYPYVCPFCGDRRGKFTVNVKKNVYGCFKCGNNGNMLDLYINISGDCFETGMEYKQAYRRLSEKTGNGDYASSYREVPKPIIKNENRLDADHLDLAYRALLKELTLSEEHKKDLVKRGLSEEAIQKHKFRTMPKYSKTLCKKLMDSGISLKGVPGFYPYNGEWMMVKMSGMICPVEDDKDRIIGAQIRIDKPRNGCKYVWFSSGPKSLGTPSGAPANCIIQDPDSDTVVITEGILKAVVASELSGKNFIGVPGVANWKSAMKYIESNGFRNIKEAYDMDKLLNIACRRDDKHCDICDGPEDGICVYKEAKQKMISESQNKLHQFLRSKGYICKVLTWDKAPDGTWAGNLKGVDDMLLVRKRK